MPAALDVYKDWLGIPEGPRPPDHYELLRLVRFEDDAEKVRKHYQKLNAHVRKYATGQFSKESQDLLNELAKAMLCLTDAERKHDYDRSLGREFEERAADRRPMEDVLVEQGTITPDQRDEARSVAEARGLSIRDAVVQMKLADAETATRAYAQQLGMSYVELAEMTPDDAVLDKLPRNVVKRNEILPLFVDDDVLLVACVHEPEPPLEEEIRLRYGVPMRGVLATPLAVRQSIAKYYAPGMRDEAVAEEPAATKSSGKTKAKAKSVKAAAPRKSSGPLSDEEKRQRKLIGLLIMLWAVIGSALIDSFLIPNSWKLGTYLPFLLTLIVPPLA
ncbi:MAG TPA: hypothetical protein VML55_23610, partial [Planctomycetaceae bacterium]|nr:hypothetical protein [Planctomycetaceae bacterium]